MSTLVKKTADKTYEPAPSDQRASVFGLAADGVTPAQISMATARRLQREGKTALLEQFGLFVAGRQAVPEGKMETGAERIEEIDGKPVLVRDLIDKPAPEPDNRTTEEKIADANGVTVEEWKAAVLNASKGA